MSEDNIVREVLLSSCSQSENCSLCIWDYASGNAIRTYKNGVILSPHSVTLLQNECFIATEQNKPLLHIWHLNGQQSVRLVLPQVANCTAVTANNCYLAAGIGKEVFVWHLSSGNLLAVEQRHFQPISCLNFSADDRFLLSGGHDGMLLVYDFVSMIDKQVGVTEPLYSKTDHALPITDLHVSSFGFKSRFATVSGDRTCRLYDLVSGDALLILVCDEFLTCVNFNSPCWTIFVGCNSGKVMAFDLKSRPAGVEHHVRNELTYSGHEKKVTCLSVNLDGRILASGGEDGRLFIWDVESRQILRCIEHKAPIFNVSFCLIDVGVFSRTCKRDISFKRLKRTVSKDDFVVSVIQDDRICLVDEHGMKLTNCEIERELNKAKIINNQLYNATLELLSSNAENK